MQGGADQRQGESDRPTCGLTARDFLLWPSGCTVTASTNAASLMILRLLELRRLRLGFGDGSGEAGGLVVELVVDVCP